jgi:hypothetical protein
MDTIGRSELQAHDYESQSQYGGLGQKVQKGNQINRLLKNQK